MLPVLPPCRLINVEGVLKEKNNTRLPASWTCADTQDGWETKTARRRLGGLTLTLVSVSSATAPVCLSATLSSSSSWMGQIQLKPLSAVLLPVVSACSCSWPVSC